MKIKIETSENILLWQFWNETSWFFILKKSVQNGKVNNPQTGIAVPVNVSLDYLVQRGAEAAIQEQFSYPVLFASESCVLTYPHAAEGTGHHNSAILSDLLLTSNAEPGEK